MSDNLKKCPFCGDTPRITAFYGYDDGDINILENSSKDDFNHHHWKHLALFTRRDGSKFTNAGVTCGCGMKCIWEIPIVPVRYEDWSVLGKALVSDLCSKVAERWNSRCE